MKLDPDKIYSIENEEYRLVRLQQPSRAKQITRQCMCIIMPVLTCAFIGAFATALFLPQPARSRMAMNGLYSLILFGAGTGLLIGGLDCD